MRKINLHIIHCADTPETMDVGVEEIRRWHTDKPPKGNGWSDIGYHYVIRRNGELEFGRDLETIGAHCKGKNRTSIGTCLVGRNWFTNEQFETLWDLHRELMEEFSGIEIAGHREYDKHKTCPNFDVKGKWYIECHKDDNPAPLPKLSWWERIINFFKGD